MIVYNVTINIDLDAHDEWLKWMKEVHIPAVMRTGYFMDYKMLRLLGDEDSGGSTYAVQYTCKTMNDFLAYEEHHAPALRTEYNEKFKDKFVAFRTLLEVIE